MFRSLIKIKVAFKTAGNNAFLKLFRCDLIMYSSPLSSLIETLIQTIEIDAAALKERHVLRQTLHALMRQAKMEQLTQMRLDVRRMAGLEQVTVDAVPGGNRAPGDVDR